MFVRRQLFPLLVLCTALFACKLLKPSPEKLCKKTAKIVGKEDATSEEQAKCAKSLTTMKKDHPEKYACVSKCIDKSSDKDALDTCMTPCMGSGSSTTASTHADSPAPVDSLTSSGVKSKIESNYRYYGYDIMKEKSNSAGWAATVALGKKGPTGEVHIYKVLLADTTSKTDGYSLVAGLKRDATGATETRVGKSKVLYVECLYQRSSTESGVPKACSSYDSKISSFTDDLARSY